MTRSPCEKCKHRKLPKNVVPCSICTEPAMYADSLGHATIPTIRRDTTVEKQELTRDGKVTLPNTTKRGMPKGGWPKKEKNTDRDENTFVAASFKTLKEVSDLKRKYNISEEEWLVFVGKYLDVFGNPCSSARYMPESQARSLIADINETKAVKPNIPGRIDGKLDHKPDHLLFPTPDHLKTQQPKFDLSHFQKVSFERRVMGKPMVRIGRNECSFNVTAHLDYGLEEIKSYDVYIDRGKTMTQIAFVPRTDDDGT